MGMTKERIARLEARLRALEAILQVMPAVFSDDVLAAAPVRSPLDRIATRKP